MILSSCVPHLSVNCYMKGLFYVNYFYILPDVVDVGTSVEDVQWRTEDVKVFKCCKQLDNWRLELHVCITREKEDSDSIHVVQSTHMVAKFRRFCINESGFLSIYNILSLSVWGWGRCSSSQ